MMKNSRIVLGVGVVVAVLGSSFADPAETNAPPARSTIPYVATRSDTVQDMLWLAEVGKDDVVYDLGSGDGRIVNAAVRDFGARRAVGIEIEPERVWESRKNAEKAGVSDLVEFIQGDLFTSDFREASVVTLFLGHKANITLRPKMLGILEPGTRIVSHQFGMGEWEPDKRLTVRTVFLGMSGFGVGTFWQNRYVPDYAGNEGVRPNDTVMMWIVPAPVAGVWRGKFETAQGPMDCRLILHQRLSRVYGTFQLSGHTDLTGAGELGADLWGNHLRLGVYTVGQLQLRFDGHVHGNTMQGTLAVSDRGQIEEHAWEAQRDRADFTGTWEWPCVTGPRSVRLRIERRDGELIATYLDRDEEIPVTDFYDFGGGFYFTVLIGGGEWGIEIAHDTGWLIGEATLNRGALEGTIQFYPTLGETDRKDWTPRLIEP